MNIEALDALIGQREAPRRTRSRAARKRHLAKLRRMSSTKKSRKNNR